jgi:hypothetical protein
MISETENMVLQTLFLQLANIMTMSIPAASRNATETQQRFCMMVYLKFWADYIMHLSKPTIRS